MNEKISKLKKQGYKWIRVSEMYNEIHNPEYPCEGKRVYPGYSGLWCKLLMAVTSYAMTNNAIAVIHGPSNCAWAVRNFKSTDYSLYYGNAFLHIPVTKITQQDIISGGSKKLYTTLLEADDIYKPEQICVFDTCSTALIADDVENTINKAQEKCKSKIVYINSAGFTAPQLGKAIEETSEKYINMMEKPDFILEDTVNLIGQYKESFPGKMCPNRAKKQGMFGGRGKYPDDATELVRYIESLGLKLHRVLISGNPDYIKTAPEASVNVISCPTWGIPLAKKMQEEFGTPYLKHSVPIGIESTKRWIRDLAYYTGKTLEAEEFINNEEAQLKPLLYRTSELVRGKVALIECGRNSMTAFARPMALARFLQELGMKPYLFGLHPQELKFKKMDLDYFLWDGFDPLILSGSYPYQQPVNINNIVEDLGINQTEYIYFTEDVFPAARAGFIDPSETPRVESGVHLRRVINAPGRGVGFRGAEAIMKNIIEAVMASKRRNKPSLYGRVHGNFYEY